MKTLLAILLIVGTVPQKPVAPEPKITFEKTFGVDRPFKHGICCYCSCMRKEIASCQRLCGRVVEDGRPRAFNPLENKQCQMICKRK